MATPAIIHMIGTLALVIVLAFVILHVSSTITVMKNDALVNNFKRIADSVSTQILYAIMWHNNLSIRLMYPPQAGYGQQYNIIIGTGAAIRSHYKIFNVPNDNTLYIVITTPDNTIHVEKKIIETTNGYTTITMVNDPILFGSSTITYLDIRVVNNNIYVNIVVKGEIYR
ncbi:hypothetical protein Smar_1474 [Staphylothermus marinus F1]|uniref:Uncharacterized protein n=1 Tax=Staphylothermus marinus (strain ATCC 43588 / DSM 3639 / JCM 9404 / F1) TaxID=399550 RepID=A3DPK3_STAMF|nr:hypothetical protein [Staphylothermus marinus]ABN70563.1 hypothetical protein Smar_1474 [Staphylothermus marinus F1]